MKQLIFDCYLFGQTSEAQWVEHLKDDDFRVWLDNVSTKEYTPA